VDENGTWVEVVSGKAVNIKVGGQQLRLGCGLAGVGWGAFASW
jgi:hypothetical protein